MPKLPIKSARGVYYDLQASPYTFFVCGEIFKFSSKKKLEIFTRELPKRIDQVQRNYKQLEKILGSDYQMSKKIEKRIATLLYESIER
jgi:hypothetical protein